MTFPNPHNNTNTDPVRTAEITGANLLEVRNGLTDMTDPSDLNAGAGGPGSSGSGSNQNHGSIPPNILARMTAGQQGGPGGVEDILIDYNAKFAQAAPAKYRDRVLSNLMACLISYSKPNAMLVGDAGVGKTRVVEELARMIATGDPAVAPRLRDSTIMELPLSSLVSGAGIVGQLEERITEVVDYATDPDNNVILFIDEMHMLTAGESASSTYGKIAQILKPALARGDLRVIGATTSQESRSMDDDPAFKRRFTRITVAEFTRAQTVDIVHSALPTYLNHYRNQITVYPDLAKHIVDTADEKTDASLHRPDNALTLLDRAMAAESITLTNLISQGIAPTTQTATLTRRKIVSIAESMATSDATVTSVDFPAMTAELSRLIGQEGPTSMIATALRRDQMNIMRRTKPLTFMLPGPSGVGKTETSRIIARHLTGTEPIRLNMTEYSSPMSATKLIGSSEGYLGSDSNREMPLDPLRSNPRQVLLLDEIEKAHEEVRNLFLSALDTGVIDMARGSSIDLRQTIIIATTNAARDTIGATSAFGFDNTNLAKARAQGDIAQRRKITKALEEHFSPEFLGRFAHLVPFNRITQDNYQVIISELYQSYVSDILDRSPSLRTKLPESLPDDIAADLATSSYVPELGARPAATLIENLIGDLLDPIGIVDGTSTATAVEGLSG